MFAAWFRMCPNSNTWESSFAPQYEQQTASPQNRHIAMMPISLHSQHVLKVSSSRNCLKVDLAEKEISLKESSSCCPRTNVSYMEYRFRSFSLSETNTDADFE